MGTCSLSNLDLACDKLNQAFFNSQPFSLYKGHISQFQLKIPWTRILQESIEIRIDGIEIWLFLEDFNEEKMKASSNQEKNPIEETLTEELYDTKVDVFKKIVNKILLNMTIEITRIKIRVFSNRQDLLRYHSLLTEEVDFSDENHEKVPGVLLKVSRFAVKKKKNEANLLKSSSFFLDEIEDYFIDFSEISGHIIEDPMEEKPGFFSNLIKDKKAEGFQYPSISFPGTFLTVSNGCSVHIQKKKLSDEVVRLEIRLGALEATLDPKEMGVLKEMAEKLGGFIQKKADFVKDIKDQENNKNPIPMPRNRSLSNLEKEKNENKETKASRKLSYKPADANLANINNNNNTLNNSLRLVNETSVHSTHQAKSEEKKEPDLLKVLIMDYIKKTEKNPEFTIELYEKPSITPITTKKTNPPPIEKPKTIPTTNISEEQLFLNQAEVLFGNLETTYKTSPTPFKFELILKKFCVVLPGAPRNIYLQDQFARPWLFSQDHFMPNSAANKNPPKYNIGFQNDTLQLVLTDLMIKTRNSNEIKGSLRKMRIFLIKLQEETLDKSAHFEEESELFHSAQCSLTMSFLNPRKLERKLVFFKRKQPVFIKEILRLASGKSPNKSLFKNAIQSTGAMIERPLGMILSSMKQAKPLANPDFAMTFTYKTIEKGLEISLNPIYLSLDLFKLAFIVNYLSQMPLKAQNLKESHINLNKSLSISISRHVYHRKQEKSQEISLNLTCEKISIDFEDLNLSISDPFISKPPLFGFFKASFSSAIISLCRRNLQFNEAHCYPFIIIDSDEALNRKNSMFFEAENLNLTNEKTMEEENNEFLQGKYQEIMRKRQKLGVFINNLKVFGYLETIKLLRETLNSFNGKMEKFALILDQRKDENLDKKKTLSISIILDKISVYLNIETLKPNIYSTPTLNLFDFNPSLESLSHSMVFKIMLTQLFVLSPRRNLSPRWNLALALQDLLVIDQQISRIALDCPLKLVQGSNYEDRKKTLKGPFFEKLKDVEKLEGVLIYKQGFFQKNNFANENLEFFSDFRVLNSETAALKACFFNGNQINLSIKGLVMKLGLFNEEIRKKLAFFLSIFDEKDPEIIEKPLEKPNKMEFSLEINELVWDLFPSYSSIDVLMNPELFNFRHCDLDPNKKGLFFFNSRSIVLLDGFKLSFSLINSSLELNQLQIKKIRTCLLQFFDFEAFTNPLIFNEFSKELSIFYGTLLEKLGFMPIFEVLQLEFRLFPMKSLSIGSISIDSCQDSMKVLFRHINSVILSISTAKKTNFQEKSSKKPKKPLLKKESFIVIDEQELLEEESKENETFQVIQRFRNTISQGFLHDFFGENLRNSLKISISSLAINLYDGIDFDFLGREKASDLDFSQKFDETSEKSKGLIIVQDYFSNNNKQQAKSPLKQDFSYRKRNRVRCLQRLITLISENLMFSYYEFEEKGFKAAFSLGTFEVLDNINTSNIKKILSEDMNKDPCLEKNGFLSLEIEGNLKEKEAVFCLKLGNLKLFFNGMNVEFLLAFFNKETNKEEEDLYWMNEYYGQNNMKRGGNVDENEGKIDFFASHPNVYSKDLLLGKEEDSMNEEDPKLALNIKLKLVYIEEFQITVDYDATFSNLNKVLENSLNFINIGNINSLKLLFKEIFLRDEILTPELILKIVDSYKNDIILNQKPSILKKLPYINNLFNVLEGFANIFYIPYKEALEGGSVEKGVLKGIGSFAKAISIEGLNFTEVVLGFGLRQLGVEKKKKGRFLEGVIEKVRGKIDPNEKEKKGEKYKKK